MLGGIAGEGSTVESASTAALSRVATRLDEVGLDRAQILRVPSEQRWRQLRCRRPRLL